MRTTENKIALVTGGSRGLGKDAALQLAQKGFNVIITYNNSNAEANSVVAEIEQHGKKAKAIQLDISNTTGFDGFIATLQGELKNYFSAEKIDALVHNAGIGHYAPFNATTEEGFDSMVNIHLKAPYFLTQKLLPLLNDGGSIVNTSSGLARFSYPGYSAYGIMKAAIDSLTRYQAVELGARKIRVNSIAPGAIETDFAGGVVRSNKELNNAIASQTPLGRVGLADDIGSVTAFLCSNDAKWVTGQRIEVAGGIHI